MFRLLPEAVVSFLSRTSVLRPCGTPVLMSQAPNIIVVQRLAPRLCQSCVREDEVSPDMLDNLRRAQLLEPSPETPLPPVSATMLDSLRRLRLVEASGPIRLPRPVGCEACDRRECKGRVPVVEGLGLRDEIRAVPASGAPPAELLKKAEEAGEFVSFSRYARMPIARKLLAPSDAVHIVAE